MSKIRRPLADRFWEKVDKNGPIHPVLGTACWEWTAAFFTHGYGQFSLRRSHPVPAHRTAWVLTNGPVADGLHVCHACDNKKCCNPAHLWTGTAAQNNHDKAAKGRASNGAMWSQEDVTRLRAAHAGGKKPRYSTLAAEFGGRHQSNIRRVAQRLGFA